MIKNAWERLPAWLRGLLGIVAALLVVALVRAVIDEVASDHPVWGLALNVASLVLITIGLYAPVRVGRRRVGGRAQHELFRRAIWSGRLPADADRDRWRPLLEKAAADSSGAWAYGFLALLVFGVNVSVLAGLDDPGPGLIAAAIGIAVVVAVFFPGIPWWIQHRNRRNARRLLEQLPPHTPSAE